MFHGSRSQSVMPELQCNVFSCWAMFSGDNCALFSAHSCIWNCQLIRMVSLLMYARTKLTRSLIQIYSLCIPLLMEPPNNVEARVRLRIIVEWTPPVVPGLLQRGRGAWDHSHSQAIKVLSPRSAVTASFTMLSSWAQYQCFTSKSL